MNMKRTDLAKSLGRKIDGKSSAAGIPDRFGAEAAKPIDKRELRKQERALGQVAFACKLPADLVAQLLPLAAAHQGGMNALVAAMLTKGLAEAQ